MSKLIVVAGFSTAFAYPSIIILLTAIQGLLLLLNIDSKLTEYLYQFTFGGILGMIFITSLWIFNK